MFFQLQQIYHIQKTLQTFSQSKQSLQQYSLNSYSCNPNNISLVLKQKFKQILDQSSLVVSLISQIQNQVQMGYFIPDQINIQQFLPNQELPQWFGFVFIKQYHKYKKILDTQAKKIYKIQALQQLKSILIKDLASFNHVIQRYQTLSDKDKHQFNIMNDAQIIRNKIQNAKERYGNFCKSITQKIVTFIHQSAGKSLNFSNSMSIVVQNTSNTMKIKVEPQRIHGGFLTNKFHQNMGQTSYEAFNARKTNKSMDFYARATMLPRATLGITRNNQFSRYVPRYAPNISTNTLSDFYK